MPEDIGSRDLPGDSSHESRFMWFTGRESEFQSSHPRIQDRSGALPVPPQALQLSTCCSVPGTVRLFAQREPGKGLPIANCNDEGCCIVDNFLGFMTEPYARIYNSTDSGGV